MNKMAKGALATGVGVALLLGGGGTLAIWNDTETASTGQIAAGQLNIARINDGVWTDASGNQVDLSTYKIVPGETLSFEQEIDITLEGDRIKASLAPTYVGVQDGLTRVLDYSYEVAQGGTKINTAALTEANDGLAKVSATVTFKVGADNSTQLKTQDLSRIQYVLTQIP